MKKLFILLSLIALMPLASVAQDGRQRTTTTIVADGLAQLPAATPEAFNAAVSELAATGAEGIRMMAGMLVPAAEGQNAKVEYGLDGVVRYVTAPGREAMAAEIRKGLVEAVDACTDKVNKAFLMSLLQLTATPAEAQTFVKYLADKDLADAAMRGLISTPGTEQTILGLMPEKPCALFAYACAEKGIAAAEPKLLAWAPQATDDATKEAIYNALAKCGSAASLPTLAAAAKAAAYTYTPNDANGAYVALVKRLGAAGDKKALAAAKALTATTMTAHNRISALGVLLKADPAKQEKTLTTALKDADRAYRCAALDYALDLISEKPALVEAIGATVPTLKCPVAKTDVISWLGTQHAQSQSAIIIAEMNAENAELAEAAIRAAGKIGGEEALNALIAALDGAHGAAAMKALDSFNGNPSEAIAAALEKSQGAATSYALTLVGKHRIAAAAPKVFALLNAESQEVADLAYAALAGVTTPKDVTALCDLMDKADAKRVAALQAGLKNALASLAPQTQYEAVAARMAQAPQEARYYPLLAQAGNEAAINALLAAKERDAAFQALLTVENPAMVDVLYKLAQESAYTDAAISRYTDFVATSGEADVKKFERYKKGLEMNPSAATQKKILTAISKAPVFPALGTAAEYMEKEETARTAAMVVKTIVAKNPTFGGPAVTAALNKALEIYSEWAKTNADAGYAVDEIKGLMAKLPASEPWTLSAEEEKEGFVVLFDGTSLDGWTGNKTNYMAINGNIDVSAQYGGTGNLYTEKQYSNFVLRFEFCFLREGVNNGIGIRTEHGVDAAYHGMEIQVLDHDAPIYKDLREYQQHGSVYGIIPAKRVKFPALGTWNVEEIVANGDHITVTVNGEVIVDGNIRKACKGHNVAPDGSNKNPYTVDHLNHPGLFNKSGYICLCGHGEGIQFRHVRIKELPAK